MIKSTEQITKMRVAGRLTAQVLEMIAPYVQPGVSTAELDQRCHDYITQDLQAIPSTLNHHGFPNSICTSVNQVICHGIPSDKKILKNGDIINIDVTVKKDGYIGDSSQTFLVGEVKPYAKRLVTTTQSCMYNAIKLVKPGTYLGDIGHSIQTEAEAAGFSVVQEYGGHGIGKSMWEEPHVMHWGEAGTGMQLQAGMTFTIEPMLNLGSRHIKQLNDGWTIVTKDRKLSAQWEHTILVTDSGYEVLTKRTNEENNI